MSIRHDLSQFLRFAAILRPIAAYGPRFAPDSARSNSGGPQILQSTLPTGALAVGVPDRRAWKGGHDAAPQKVFSWRKRASEVRVLQQDLGEVLNLDWISNARRREEESQKLGSETPKRRCARFINNARILSAEC
jgi:hypothetical protein